VFLLFKLLFLLSLLIFSVSGVSDKQRVVIDNQIFLLKEGMITKDKVFEKAKKFDDTGIFGIGSDEMTKKDFEEYLKSKSFTIHD
tara:strand:- start:188 stop:442 length:255 start_codon:yes stop_codon:yes gene_type:complete